MGIPTHESRHRVEPAGPRRRIDPRRDDAALLEDLQLFGSTTGIYAAPEGAACLTALKQLLADGWLDGSERVLLFNTGSGLKYAHLGA